MNPSISSLSSQITETMSSNLEALVEAASGAHPIPEETEAAAQAAEAEALADAEESIEQPAPEAEPDPEAEPEPEPQYEPEPEPQPEPAPDTDADADTAQAQADAESAALVEAASAAAAEANAAVAAAVAAIEPVKPEEVEMEEEDPLTVASTTKNELAKNMPGARIVERRRKGWVKKTWEERLEELKAYKVIHGDANVPTLSKENPSLGHWVHDQRKQYRLFNEKKQTAMTPHRIEQLEAVGFKWALQRHTTMKSWAERFEELKTYKAEKGDCNVPIRFKGNPSLGQWVSTQRQEYGAKNKNTKTNINEQRISELEGIGFIWSLRDTSKMAPRKSWDAHYESLVEFKEKNGHCDVRVRSKQHPTGSLGRWVEKQRHHYNSREEDKDNKITPEQIKKLEDLGFKWRVRNEKRSVVEKRESLAKQKAEDAASEEAKAQEETAAGVAAELAEAAMDVDVTAVVVEAMEASVQAAVDAKMEVDGIEVPESLPVSEMEVGDMDIPEGTVDVAV